MEGGPDSEVEYEVMEDEEEHEEFGGIAFEPEIVDPKTKWGSGRQAPEPMDDGYDEWIPEPESESEAMSSEEDREPPESSSESSGSDPDWVP
ncbi:hypothetical protein NL676_006282 [Syzygium grande]|nr:hypothetical protein NL676_006282 [Syzygium grande]